MTNYWDKFFDLTVTESCVNEVNSVLASYSDNVKDINCRLVDVDGERIAHYTFVILENGKKIFKKIIQKLNSH